MNFYFTMQVTGSSQGPFVTDPVGAPEGRQRCYQFHFKGRAANDPTRGADSAARSHEPLRIVKEWGPSSPQFMQAYWNNEVLSKVVFEFADPLDEKHEPFERITLEEATIVLFERKAADHPDRKEGDPFWLEEIGFRFEKMEHKSIPGKKVAKYDWKNRG